MTDKELVQERIKELETAIAGGRQTGKTYKAINKCVEELFDRSIGSQIHLIDNPPLEDPESLRSFAAAFAKHMQTCFPEVGFKISYPKPGVVVAMRTTETYQETAKKRLEQWKKKLEGME